MIFKEEKMILLILLKKYGSYILIVQIYVDDIIFGCCNLYFCENFDNLIRREFKMNFMGEISFFIGLQINK